MTIQEYIKIAANGYPVDEFKYYLPFFLVMSCEHCIYNGHACRHPETDDVCIDYKDRFLTIWLNPSGTMAVRVKVMSMCGGTKLMAEGLLPTASCLHQILKACGEEEIFTHIMERYESTIQKD